MTSPSEMWESRYASETFVYGTDPNDFLASAANDLPVGRALCLADGEGRNGVHLASLGHTVTSVDFSQSGMNKATQLAAERGVQITTVVADLAEFDLGVDRWDLIVSIFAHTPPDVRRSLHERVARSLSPEGALVLEAYTPQQIGRGTGGPPVPELTMTLDGLRGELRDMTIVEGREIIRPVLEGPGHTGDGAVVQVIAGPTGSK